ncbi:hypothetical protein AB0M39_06730 [Streptomyces sp. NPDC051907]|uniref:hypothetical protein n=1 Tax=Streptomyces sp. NPDC051907 TaxID=3155284 RepID=UPI00341453FC
MRACDHPVRVAVGSYTTGVQRHVHLHGENHLRHIVARYDEEAAAIAEFQRLHSVAVRPGPSPLTELEKSVCQLRAGKPTATTADQHTSVTTTAPPVAAPGEHEAFLEPLVDEARWERYRPFDESTVAPHEFLTVRAEFDHGVAVAALA